MKLWGIKHRNTRALTTKCPSGVSGNGFYLLDINRHVTTTGYGILMYSGGTVCDDAFNDNTANWVCRMMGYESLNAWENDRKYSWQDNYPIRLANIKCPGIVVPKCKYN